MIVVGTQECSGREGCGILPWPDSLPELIRRSAAERLSADAVRLGDETVSYGELESRSDRLALRLRGLGVGRDVLVGLLVDRTPAMVVALLAILKAGGAYVPLDPSYPVMRIDETLADADVDLLISETSIVARLGLTYRAPTLLLDEVAEEHGSCAALGVECLPEDTAYVIFTSGSTGKPKGVEILHGALVNVLLSMRDEPGMSAGDTLLAVTSLAFDIAAVEMFLPLIVGGRIELASQEEVSDPSKLLAKVNGCGVTILQATPVTWRLLVLAGWTGRLPLRVWCGGEEMTQTLARDLLERSAEVWNLYGPTETTIWSSLMRVQEASGTIPLGLPVADTSLFVLDEDRHEVEAGVAGELYIGGAGLAKGYWGQPELTRASFPTVRLGDGCTMRLYKTRDWVRRGENGRLEFLGRLDRQVKLRGFRIELAEIEHVARGCAGIDEVVVVKVEDAERGGSLAAFAVAQQGVLFEAAGLRHHLAARLPPYMIPSAIRMVDRLPVTANGKLDCKRLVSLTMPELVILDAFDEPHEGLENRLAGVWREALGVTHLGRHDNFFGMGGDSLLAAQVEIEMAQRVDARCGVGSLLRAPTIACYAAQLGGVVVPTSVLLNVGRMADDGIFWMDNPDRLPRLAGLLGERPFYSMLLSPEDIAREAPRYPLERLAARVVDHILALQAGGRFTVGGFCQNALLAYEVGQQLRARGFGVPLLVMIDPVDDCVARKRDLSLGRMLRRIEREWFHLSAMLRLAPSGWGGYLRQRYEGMRFELEGRRWQRAARKGSQSPRPVPELAQALFASRLSYVPQPYAGRVLFIEPTLRPGAKDLSRAEKWGRLVTAGRWCSVVGDHLGLFASPAVERLAVAVKQALDEVTASS